MQTSLSSDELKRYARHLSLPGFGLEAQEKLKRSRVLVLGAGGLGSPVLLYLAAAGVGQIDIVDFDRIETSNLQRQVLFTSSDQGDYKADAAARRIQALNPHIIANSIVAPFSRENAMDLIEPCDLVIDGTDNFPTRYLSNDACVLAGKPLIYGSIYRFEGQASVFNMLRADGSRGPNYRDLFPSPPPPELVPNCAEGGVLGVLPGLIGSLQASEAIKVLAQIGQPLDGKLYLFDASSMISRTISIPKNPDIKITALIDYEQFCNPAGTKKLPAITAEELAAWRASRKAHLLVDVREASEYEISNIGGRLLPWSSLKQHTDLLDPLRNQRLVVHCRSGQRSAQAVRWLLEEQGFEEVYNLEGGILAWSEAVDPNITVY
jgi:adenylyltransferase/sulfurtransferase